MADMTDPEYLALDLVEAGAERHVEILEHHLAEMIGVMAFRHPHPGQRRRIRMRILALGFQAPGFHRSARRCTVALAAGEALLEAPLLPHPDGFLAAVRPPCPPGG